MKRFFTYLFTALCCLAGLSALAQQPVSKRDKIDALRMSFINQKVNFTAAESEAFWPLYKEYGDKLEQARRSFRQKYKNIDFSTISDKDAEICLDAEGSLKQKEYELYKEYIEKFKKVLPVKKVAMFRKAEEEFKKELIRNIKGNPPEQ